MDFCGNPAGIVKGGFLRGSAMIKFAVKGEYITLGQLLKAAGLVDSGVEAKEAVQAGEALVDGSVDERRGRKLYGGETVLFRGTEIRVVR